MALQSLQSLLASGISLLQQGIMLKMELSQIINSLFLARVSIPLISPLFKIIKAPWTFLRRLLSPSSGLDRAWQRAHAPAVASAMPEWSTVLAAATVALTALHLLSKAYKQEQTKDTAPEKPSATEKEVKENLENAWTSSIQR
jgi:hypothetical protein